MKTMFESTKLLEHWSNALRMYDAIREVPEDRYGTLRLCILLVMIARSFYSDSKWREFKEPKDKIWYLGQHATQFMTIAYGMGNCVPRTEGSKPMGLALREMEYWAKWAKDRNTSLLTVRRFTSLGDDKGPWEDVTPAVYLSQIMGAYQEYWQNRKLAEAKPDQSAQSTSGKRKDKYDPENNPENNPENTNPENEKE